MNDARSPAFRPPPLVFDERALGLVKWLALALMVVDHANFYLLDGSQPWMRAMGRVAMPLFAFVLGYNLGRPGALASGAYARTASRLLVFALLTTPAFIGVNALYAGWYPLNMMFALLVAVLAAWCVDRGGGWNVMAACVVVAVGGGMVEFWWPGAGLCLAIWAYRRRPSIVAGLAGVTCLAALSVVNGSHWAMAAVPVLALASFWRAPLPRARWFFYAFYPLHYTAIWAFLAWRA